MALTDVVRLVKSLSRVEKRQFKLATKKQTGNKDYLDLFDLIDQCEPIDLEFLKEAFKKSHPGISPDNAARYLLNILTDNLITSKIKSDNTFQVLHGLMRVQMLEERSITTSAHKELKKLRPKAVLSQDPIIRYLIFRKEMEYLSAFNFDGTTEKQLIELQIEGRGMIKSLHNIHEHRSLYELLKYRLIHSGKALSDEDKKHLNDLILNEMGLMTGRIKQHFESQKLHLLFQSFFFTSTGDYKSALKTFHDLNKLFERNTILWRNPPLDYFSALDGILDSLRANNNYNEMEFYILKMEQLSRQSYPEYFQFLILKTVALYHLIALIGSGDIDSAYTYINDSNNNIFNTYNLIDAEKQSELLFQTSLVYYKKRNYKQAQKSLNKIINIGVINYQSVIYRASRLLNIILSYEEQTTLDYLDYEIRSYKRSYQQKGKALKTEKLILKTIQINPRLNKPVKNKLLWKKVAPLVLSIEKDKYEKQLLKYFDFVQWVRIQFNQNT